MQHTLEINWAEGIFLRPHHLQHNNRYFHDLLNAELSGVRPFYYGIAHLEISEAELESEVINVRALEVRMKSGTWLSIPENGELAPRDLKEALDLSRGSTLVFIGTPVLRDREPNTILQMEELQDVSRRYRATSLKRVDENTGENNQLIEVRKFNPKMFFGHEDMTGYEVVPLCQIERTGEDETRPVLSYSSIPPVLTLSAWAWLENTLKDIYHKLIAKNKSLGSRFANKQHAFNAPGAGGVDAILKLCVINRYVASLRQITMVPQLHPFDAYIEYCKLAGDLAIFDDARTVPDLPEYNHDNLSECFLPLIDLINRYINNLMPTTFIRRKFAPKQNYFVVTLDSQWIDDNAELYLGIEFEGDGENLKQRLETTILSAEPDLEVLKRHRIRGLMTRNILDFQELPADLPRRGEHHPIRYFQIDRTGPFWTGNPAKGLQGVATTRALACYDEKLDDLDLYVYVLPKSGKEART